MSLKKPVNIEDFEIIEPVSTGSYFNLFKVRYKETDLEYYLKEYFWNVDPNKVCNEVKMLREMDSSQFLRPVTVMRSETKMAALFEYRPFKYFRSLLDDLSGIHIVNYMKALLGCITELHEKQIICRDIKPSTFFFDSEKETGFISEMFFAERVVTREICHDANPNFEMEFSFSRSGLKGSELASRGGTRGFRAPEVLFGAINQTTAIDVWSAGVVFLSLIMQRHPFFVGENDMENLCQIAAIFGGKRIREAADECGCGVNLPAWIPEKSIPFHIMILAMNPTRKEKILDARAFDLLERMLEPVPSKRITAKEALLHPFITQSKS